MKPTFTKIYGTQRDPRLEEIRNRVKLRDIDTKYSCVIDPTVTETILYSETLTYELRSDGVLRQLSEGEFDPSAPTMDLDALFHSCYDLKRHREQPLPAGATIDNTALRLAQLTTLEDSGLNPDTELGREHAYIKQFLVDDANDQPVSDEKAMEICLDTAMARSYEKTLRWTSQFRRVLMLKKLGLYPSYRRYYNP